MRLIKPSFEILTQEPGIDGLLRHIELCGRTAYKSEDAIKEGSAKKFVDMITKRGHGAVLEHGTISLKVDWPLYHLPTFPNTNTYLDNILDSQYAKVEELPFNRILIITNLRVLFEQLPDLYTNIINDEKLPQGISVMDNIRHLHRRVTVKFTCDRGVSHKQFCGLAG
jgi:hypothetical protein